MMNKNVRNFVLALVVCASVCACSTVPIIGRKQMNLLPESQLVSMSLTSYKEFLDTNQVVASSNSYQKMITEVGANISKAVEKFLKENGLEDRISDFSWEFNLVNDATVNAWCMPGGKVVFYQGIMPICKDKNGVAVVMGHEIAHAVARHGNERTSQELISQLGSSALDIALSQQPEQTKNIFLTAYGVGSEYAVLLPFSRKHEYEADKLGLILMAMAGYDPNEAILFWTRMSQLTGSSSTPEFLSTHPTDANRIAELKAYLPEVEKYKP